MDDPLIAGSTGIRRKVDTSPLSSYLFSHPLFQIYRTIFDHLTMTVMEIVIYLKENPTPRKNIQRYPLIKVLCDRFHDAQAKANPTKKNQSRATKDTAQPLIENIK